ncbi:MAG: LpxI family protein [Hyphomicrobiaceae bacterium]
MTTTTEPLGILAGGGSLPVEIARLVRTRGRPVHIVGLGGEIGAELASHPHTVVPWGAIGALLRAFRDRGCREIVIAGGVRRPNLRQISPDWGLVRALPTIVRLFEGGDDSVLKRVVRFFEGEGFRVLGIPDVAPELVIGAGAMTPTEPSAEDLAAIRSGFDVIRALAPLDVGQAVVMAGARPIAIEGADGTDRMLARVRADGVRAVLVKRPKPGQELRVDLPVIGSATIRHVVSAGLAGIGVEAGRVLVADRTDMIAAAAGDGVFVWGEAGRASTPAPPPEPGVATPVRVGRRPGARDNRDIALGRAAIAALGPWIRSPGAVVIGGYVVAIAADEPAIDLLARAARMRPWGFRTRRGVAVIGGGPDAALVAKAAEARLAGIVFLSPPGRDGWSADRAAAGLFVLHPAAGTDGRDP